MGAGEGELAGSISVVDRTEVFGFYSNLFRTAAMARPLKPANEKDFKAAGR